jgi:hypothetical protein
MKCLKNNLDIWSKLPDFTCQKQQEHDDGLSSRGEKWPREGHTSSLNKLYASLTSTLSFPQYARLLSRLTSYTLLLRTLDSIQQSKHDRLLDTLLRTHEQRNQETSSQLRICQQILGWICTKSKASSERSATVALIPESAHAPRAHAPARTALRAT